MYAIRHTTGNCEFIFSVLFLDEAESKRDLLLGEIQMGAVGVVKAHCCCSSVSMYAVRSYAIRLIRFDGKNGSGMVLGNR
jgi:hypothetical protein